MTNRTYLGTWKKELPVNIGKKVSNKAAKEVEKLRGLQKSCLLRIMFIALEGIAPSWMVKLFRAMAEINYLRTMMELEKGENEELRALMFSM